MKFTKLLCILVVCFMALPVMFGLTGCKNKEHSQIVNAKEIYALSAITSVNYLQHLESKSTALLAQNTETLRPNSVNDDNVKGIKNCLGLFDSLITSGNLSQSTTKNSTSEEEFKDYNFVMTISLLGFENSIKMYYDEINSVTKIEIEDDVEETEISTTLCGVMVVNENRYDVFGEKKIETEGKENEISIEFTTKSRINPDNYIVITQSVETESNEREIQYEYKVYTNKVLLQETELEIEHKNNEIELEFKLKDLSNNQYNKTIYKLKKGFENNSFIIEYNFNETKEIINVIKIEDGYKFVYSNGYKEIVKF